MAERRDAFRKYLLQTARRNVTDENYDAALSHYLMALKFFRSLALSVKDEFVFCLSLLTNSLRERKDVAGICDVLHRAQNACSFSSAYSCMLIEEALRLNLQRQAVRLARAALAAFPGSVKVEELWEHVSYLAVERWHFRMLNDLQRNLAYHDAIVDTIHRYNVSSVLDIGSGTGLLSLFALEVDSVQYLFSCEVSPVLAEINRECVSSAAGLCAQRSARHIENAVFECHSTSLSVPSPLPSRVDLIVTEIFDAALFGEQCLDTLSHAWAHLLKCSEKKKGWILPMGATVKICGLECEEVRRDTVMLPANIPLLDLRATAIFSTTALSDSDPYTTEDLFHVRDGYKLLSSVQDLVCVNFSQPESYPSGDECTELTLEVTRGGCLDALAVWFDLHLTEDHMVTSAPSASCCWEQAIFPVLEPVGQGPQGANCFPDDDPDSLSVSTLPLSHTRATFRMVSVEAEDKVKVRVLFKEGVLHLKLVQVVRSCISTLASDMICLQSCQSNDHVAGACHIECCVEDRSEPAEKNIGTVPDDSKCEQDTLLDSGSSSKNPRVIDTQGDMQHILSGGDRQNVSNFILPCREVRRLNDLKCHNLFVSALRFAREQIPGKGRVLDLSCGFPLLGLLSLKLGFHHAVLCCGSTNPQMDTAALAKSIAQNSGLDRSSWVWCDLQGEQELDTMMSAAEFDVVVTDIVETTGCIRSDIADKILLIRRMGLREDGWVIPQAVDVYAIVISSPLLASRTRVTSDDNTLSHHVAQHINQFQTRTCLDVDLHSLPHTCLTDHFHVFHLDLSCDSGSCNVTQQRTTVELTVVQSGEATAVVYYFKMLMAPGLSLSTADRDTVWRQAAYMLPGENLATCTPLGSSQILTEGQVIQLHAQLYGAFLRFSLGGQSAWTEQECSWCGLKDCVCNAGLCDTDSSDDVCASDSN